MSIQCWRPRGDQREALKAATVPSFMASPDAFSKFVAQEFKRWGELVKEKKITATD